MFAKKQNLLTITSIRIKLNSFSYFKVLIIKKKIIKDTNKNKAGLTINYYYRLRRAVWLFRRSFCRGWNSTTSFAVTEITGSCLVEIKPDCGFFKGERRSVSLYFQVNENLKR